jgi:phosphatidylinositol alpha-1,6-mannosyltransferase
MAVLVTNDFPPDHGGIQRVMARLAQEMALQRERVLVVAPRLPGSDSFDALQRYRVLRYRGRGRVLSFAGMFVSLLRARMACPDFITLASIWFPGGLAACLLPPILRGRLIVLAHGAEIAPARRGIRRRLMRYVFDRADVIVANSRFTRELLVQAGVRGTISIINPGIDATPIAPQRSNVPTILSVGRLIPRKGFDTTIAALAALLPHYPTARYEIIGSGPQRAELERLAKHLHVENHVVFLGAVEDEQMREAYARAWVFALPTRSVADDVEGFGVVYLEAAMAQLPTIGGRFSGAEDAIVAGETGLLVDGTSSADVAAAIATLLRDRDTAELMGVRGRDRALDYFTWRRAVTELGSLAETAVK